MSRLLAFVACQFSSVFQIRNRRRNVFPHQWLMTLIMMVGLVSAYQAQAGWTDPLSTPAMLSDQSHTSLLLDVTQVEQRLVAVGAYGHIVYSDDDGVSWEQARVPVSVTLTAVDFVDGRYGWAVGHDGIILASQDAGESWVKQFDGFAANTAMVAGAEQRVTVLTTLVAEAAQSNDPDRLDTLEYALENATYALEDALMDESTRSTKPFLGVTFFNKNDGVALGAYGMFFRTRDGGKSWVDESASLLNPERLHLSQLHVMKSGAWLVTGEMGLLLLSSDGGTSWVLLDLPYDGSLFGSNESGNAWWVYGLRGHVFRSLDQGQSWKEISMGSEQTLLSSGSAPDSSSMALVGNAGTLIIVRTHNTKPGSAPEIAISSLEGRQGLAAVVPVHNGWVVVGEAGAIRVPDVAMATEMTEGQ